MSLLHIWFWMGIRVYALLVVVFDRRFRIIFGDWVDLGVVGFCIVLFIQEKDILWWGICIYSINNLNDAVLLLPSSKYPLVYIVYGCRARKQHHADYNRVEWSALSEYVCFPVTRQSLGGYVFGFVMQRDMSFVVTMVIIAWRSSEVLGWWLLWCREIRQWLLFEYIWRIPKSLRLGVVIVLLF